MGRHKPNKPRRQRPPEGHASDTLQMAHSANPFEEGPTQILFDSSDPRIEVFRKVQKILKDGGEPDPEDIQLLWDWHQENNIA